jgi:uncharacterized membrane protein
MGFSPFLFVHICSGICGLFSGAAAVALRKGSRRHALTGNIFVVSMMSLAATGVYLALLKGQPGNVLGGSFTFYLVATAWMTARRSAVQIDTSDWLALLTAFSVATVCITYGFEAVTSSDGMHYGAPAGQYFFLGSVALIALIGDIRMLMHHGIDGTQRLARHLWRMCFALFIASGSIFLARQHLFPAVMRTTGALYFLTFLPLLLMIFWLIRVRLATAYKRLFVHAQA